MKSLVIALIAITTATASAAERQVSLSTADGRQILLDIYNPGAASALVLAPGAGCGPRFDMYGALAAQAQSKGFTLVRLYWAYCISNPPTKPSPDLSLETEDMATALRFVREELGYQEARTVIGGKSQGTYVSQKIFSANKNFSALLMLTPLCTDDQADPLNPKNVFAEEYPALAGETRRILFAQGEVDPLCHRSHFEEYLSGKPENFSSAMVKGDHGFGLRNPDGTYNTELGLLNLQDLASRVGAWLAR